MQQAPPPAAMREPRMSDSLNMQILARATATAMLKHRFSQKKAEMNVSPPAAKPVAVAGGDRVGPPMFD